MASAKLPIDKTWAMSRIRSVKTYMGKSRQLSPGVFDYHVRLPKLTTNILNRYGIPHSVQKINDQMYRIMWSIPTDLLQAA